MNDLVTPVKIYETLSEHLNIELRVKHDDWYPFLGGGNKARKIKYIISDAKRQGANALVSTGAANSNHARVVAIAGANMGWPVRLIIHDKKDYFKGNLQLMKLAGADLKFVQKDDVYKSMNEAMAIFITEGYSPYYIWGGGHNIYGMKSYYDAVDEFFQQTYDWKPDYVFLASGTGGTQSGLHQGFNDKDPEVKVIGISVARTKARGEMIVSNGVAELGKELNSQLRSPIIFKDEWSGGGYEKIYPELIRVIKFAAQNDGLITDPTYTGKALTALFSMCRSNQIPKGAKVLFWHTGGLINLLSSTFIHTDK